MNQTNEPKKAASHPDVPRPSNDELVKLALEVCHAIERCGASPELTSAVMLASDLHTYLRKPLFDVPASWAVGETMKIVPPPVDKGLTAPRITPADIEANIASEHYFTAGDGATAASEDIVNVWHDDKDCGTERVPLSLLTFCVLVLRNGFTVTGESHCLNPECFDAEEGRKWARQQAVDKIGPLMAYELKARMSNWYGLQWSPEEIREIMAMDPPPVVFNATKTQEGGAA